MLPCHEAASILCGCFAKVSDSASVEACGDRKIQEINENARPSPSLP